MKQKIQSQDIAEKLSERANCPIKRCEDFIQTLLDTIAEEMSRNDEIKIQGFGSFKSVVVGERESVDVTTGERILIPSFRKLTFTPDERVKKIAKEVPTAPSVNVEDSGTESAEEGIKDNDRAKEATATGERSSESNIESGIIMAHDISILLERMKKLSMKKNQEEGDETDDTDAELSALSAIISAPEILSNARERLRSAKEKAAKARLELQAAESNLYQAEAKAKIAKENTERAKETAEDASSEAILFEKMIQNIESFKKDAETTEEDERNKGTLMQSVIEEASEESVDIQSQIAAIFSSHGSSPAQSPVRTEDTDEIYRKAEDDKTVEDLEKRNEETSTAEAKLPEEESDEVNSEFPIHEKQHTDADSEGSLDYTNLTPVSSDNSYGSKDDKSIESGTAKDEKTGNTTESIPERVSPTYERDEKSMDVETEGQDSNSGFSVETDTANAGPSIETEMAEYDTSIRDDAETENVNSHDGEVESPADDSTMENDNRQTSTNPLSSHPDSEQHTGHEASQSSNESEEHVIEEIVKGNRKKLYIVCASIAVAVIGLIVFITISTQSNTVKTIDLTEKTTVGKSYRQQNETVHKTEKGNKQQEKAGQKDSKTSIVSENRSKDTAPSAHPETTVSKEPRTHILKAGQSLTKISLMYYQTKDSVMAIARANKLTNIDNVPIGTKLILP